METMLNELRQEAATTRRLLERVPGDKLSWKPHPKSMSLGQLALHVASIPGDLARLAQLDEFDAAQANFDPASPKSVQEVLTALDASLGAAEEYLHGISNPAAAGMWRLTLRGKEVFAIPRSGLLRSLMLNHWYHHRGQLSVYLRLLDVPLPVIYGRSADESRLLEDGLMPFDDHVAHRLREILAGEILDSKEVTVRDKRMFGGLAIMVNGHMCCGIVGRNLCVRVGGNEYENVLSRPHVRPYVRPESTFSPSPANFSNATWNKRPPPVAPSASSIICVGIYAPSSAWPHKIAYSPLIRPRCCLPRAPSPLHPDAF
jgi:uncharacterized damage-inducible protein DinB